MWDRVPQILREAAHATVMPRFSKLAPEEAEFKAPEEPVTVADREAETLISRLLVELTPGARVVGEEACAADPRLLASLGQGSAWLIDPIDGTRNFMDGRPPFALMVALLNDGEIVGCCILDPVRDRVAQAELGGGAWIDGERVRTADEPRHAGDLRGIVSDAFLPAERLGIVDAVRQKVAEVLPTQRCAGHEYPQVATGERDFAIYWRSLAWDHAPGTLFLREAGGTVTHLDGLPYRPADPRPGLLLARTADVSRRLLNIISTSGC